MSKHIRQMLSQIWFQILESQCVTRPLTNLLVIIVSVEGERAEVSFLLNLMGLHGFTHTPVLHINVRISGRDSKDQVS